MADLSDSIPVTEIPRQIVEAEIELLIGLLDTLDPDPDLESTGDDEPWLGAPDARTGVWSGLWSEGNDDREEDDSDREPCCEDEGAQCDDEDGNDDEWELGWTTIQAQTGKYYYSWSMPWLVPDGEPSLGSTDRMNQAYWWQGSRDDREEEHDGREPDSDNEPDLDGEGTGNYVGACSPAETMFHPKEYNNDNQKNQYYLKDADVDPSSIRGVATLAGPFDFLPLDTEVTVATFGDVTDLASTQPINFARSDSPPFLLLSGTSDTTVYPKNSRALSQRMRDVGASVETKEYKDMNHTGILIALSKPMRKESTPVLSDILAFFGKLQKEFPNQ